MLNDGGPPDSPRLAPMPALDGLRGLAVAGVLAFHLGYLRGGFLGVDLFFVLSGFLITSLLLAEHRRRGAIDLARFWARRARRLLPALLVVLPAVAAYAWVVADPTELNRIRGDALATLGYVANWREIFVGQSYWDLFAQPSPLEHTWSLAIEEQFYILWPLIVVGVLTVAKGSRRALLVVTAGLAVASAVAMVVVHHPYEDPSRVYFGTDTRAASILIGAVLAIRLGRRLHPDHSGRHARPLGDRVAAGLGAAALVAVVASWFVASGASNWLYQGGFIGIELTVAVLIWSVARPEPGPAGRLLSVAPLRALGLISYGLYLWHWPVFVALSPERTGLQGVTLAAVRVATSVGVAAVSYRMVEQPIRHGALTGWRLRTLTPGAVMASAVLVVVSTIGGATADPSLASTAAPVVAGALQAADPTGGGLSSPVALGKTTILVAGDSGAFFAGAAMDRAAAGHGTQIVNLGQIGCGVMRQGDGLIREEDGAWFPDPVSCAGQSGTWFNEVERVDPEVVLLMLAWPGLGLREVGGHQSHPCQPEFDTLYRREVDAALDVLGHRGAEVVVATVPPTTREALPVDPKERAGCLNRIYQAAARAHPRATVLDVEGWACPGAGCRTKVDGRPLRPDGVHFEGPGADALATWALPQLVAAASGEDALSVLVAGDSTALVLAHRFPAAAHPGVTLSASTSLGCGLAEGAAVGGDRVIESDCDHTLDRYRDAVRRERPDVVVLMAGAWEVLDHRVDGRMVRFGEPAWDALIRDALTTYVAPAAELGIPVAMLTAPCFHEVADVRFPTGERNDPERVAAYNRLVHEVATANAGSATVVGYGAEVCADGRPTADLGDGVHLTPEGAGRAWRWLMPRLEALA